MNDAIIRDAFENLKYNYVKNGLSKIYDDIYREVCDIPAEMLANKITSKESKEVNNFFLQLDKEARRITMQKLKEIGIPDEKSPMVWIRARKSVRSPEVKLCMQTDYSEHMQGSGQENTASSASGNNKKPGIASGGKWLIIAGAALEIIAWIFIPSAKLKAPIVKGIGILLIAAGAAIVYKEKQETPGIKLTDAALHQAKEQSKEHIKDICKKQCELNQGVFYGWLNQICDAVIKECKAEID